MPSCTGRRFSTEMYDENASTEPTAHQNGAASRAARPESARCSALDQMAEEADDTWWVFRPNLATHSGSIRPLIPAVQGDGVLTMHSRPNP